ncbi:tryptophan 2,3-dioxygenase family protein [Hugenholtzia roseola]|uniref:tryptophan 2,3-dioxygenase family protein n=1 Tax=Hugenholtzia roseola TaxID=1002 RepID=UPI00040F8724|nr:tryptophan 2,3-dioxygenase family protein [Hugenholtzia roseola]
MDNTPPAPSHDENLPHSESSSAQNIFTPEVEKRIWQLAEKYENVGQDLTSYLDGLLYANYLTYWEYIHLDTLLSLQTPRTDFPDELIFVTYHQITELYFKLILHELNQIGWRQRIDGTFFLEKLRRVNRYVRHLINSFEIMVDGMEYEQFLRYRMSLLPASGFQSAQFRMIEIYATDFKNLVGREHKNLFDEESRIEEMFGYVYWKRGAIENQSGQKTLTLRQFERKYSEELLKLAKQCRTRNLWHVAAQKLGDTPLREKIIQEMRNFDVLFNVDWRLAHIKSAFKYLSRDENTINATGGTNWKRYLPSTMQLQIFFPTLWSEEEREEWGKHWVLQNIGRRAEK